MNYLQVSVTKAKELHKNEDLDGDVLVFLTTPAETERAQELMNADPIMSGKHNVAKFKTNSLFYNILRALASKRTPPA